MTNSEDRQKINDALARFIHSTWSSESEAKMRAAYGDEITRQARVVYDAAIDCPVDWHTHNMDTALDVVQACLDREFPWLSEEARTQLNYSFIMTWK